MQYVNLGKTGMKVSRLCIGMMTYGSKKWCEWILEEAEARPFVGRALEAGINQAIAALDTQLSDEEVKRLEELYQPHPILGHS